ncbi:predicted protein [Arabidopsis lyrata subsp. lyrata]|uniref:Predicted protein n=1 Tax=Arabidopsis lyrata subsp. lyrata TaxID=81972 RepID=D7KDM6_ARALL|nr:predicted protein [Arabidopsis lyrata subsp. lyrata]
MIPSTVLTVRDIYHGQTLSDDVAGGYWLTGSQLGHRFTYMVKCWQLRALKHGPTP